MRLKIHTQADLCAVAQEVAHKNDAMRRYKNKEENKNGSNFNETAA